ncbi:MAG: DUF6491 family protein, partial [Thermaurantiacus sp.]
MMRTTALLMAPLLLAACATPGDADDTAAAPRGSPTAANLVPAGEPVNCVQRNRIRSTHVLDDQTIDFVMTDGRVYRNTLPGRCPGLGFDRAFGYRTSVNQLCNVDIITVISSGGGPRRGASCGLGMFQPMQAPP